mmetsp:Transcript_7821/g.29273  ORF Transcript_7821/g.29273 Transcript_7821/m.29273 type:complete len:636 (-) Transcript_7821:623-2530(-)
MNHFNNNNNNQYQQQYPPASNQQYQTQQNSFPNNTQKPPQYASNSPHSYNNAQPTSPSIPIPPEFPQDRFHFPVRVLGEGTYAVVYLCETKEGWREASGLKYQHQQQQWDNSNSEPQQQQNPKYPRFIALKHVQISRHKPQMTSAIRRALAQEIQILRMLSGEDNVMRLFDVIGDPMRHDHIYLICEYCDKGSLLSLVKQQKVIPERSAKEILRQLARGLYCLYRRGIVHRDLKPANLFISTQGENGFQVKIGDFGYAKQLEGTDLTQTQAGTPLFMAPEVLLSAKDGYDIKVDCYSVGAIFYYMLTGQYPIVAKSLHDLAFCIQYSRDLTFDHILCSSEAKELLAGLLQRDSKKRMSHEQFFTHPFIDLRPGINGRSSTVGGGPSSVDDLSFSVMEPQGQHDGQHAPLQNVRSSVTLLSLFQRKSFAFFPFHKKQTVVNFSSFPMNNTTMHQRTVVKDMEHQCALAWIFAEYSAFIYKYGDVLSAITGINRTLTFLKDLNGRIEEQKYEIRLADSPRIGAIQEWIQNLHCDVKRAAKSIVDDPKFSFEDNVEVSTIEELLFLYAKNLAHEAAFNQCMNMSLDQVEPMFWRAELLFGYFAGLTRGDNDEKQCLRLHQDTKTMHESFIKMRSERSV